MKNPFNFMTSVGFGLAALLTTAGCSSTTASPPPAAEQTKTLRIATDDEPGRPAAAQIEEFARNVKEHSGGKVLIEPVWKAVGEDKDDPDQALARAVVTGDFEMGLVPARAWDTEEVSSFAALHAPFLVTSNALMAKVSDPGSRGRNACRAGQGRCVRSYPVPRRRANALLLLRTRTDAG
jgi:TRAP-type C4-dicarboxylate transport system substrate-binding protein